MSTNRPHKPFDVYVHVEPIDVSSSSCSRFSNKRASVSLPCSECREHATIEMHTLYTKTGGLIPGPRDNRYVFKCSSCERGGIPSLVHLSKTWTQAISTVLFNLSHKIGVEDCLRPELAGEGEGSSGWYPFFDITSEICPFMNKFWSQLSPQNTPVHHYWAPQVLITLSKHNDLFMPSKRVYMCENAPPSQKWGVLYTHLGKMRKLPKIEKVVKKRTNNGVTQCLVKWRGFTRFAWENEDRIPGTDDDYRLLSTSTTSTSTTSSPRPRPVKTGETRAHTPFKRTTPNSPPVHEEYLDFLEPAEKRTEPDEAATASPSPPPKVRSTPDKEKRSFDKEKHSTPDKEKRSTPHKERLSTPDKEKRSFDKEKHSTPDKEKRSTPDKEKLSTPEKEKSKPHLAKAVAMNEIAGVVSEIAADFTMKNALEATEATDPATPPQKVDLSITEAPAISSEGSTTSQSTPTTPTLETQEEVRVPAIVPPHEFLKPASPFRCATEFPVCPQLQTVSPNSSQKARRRVVLTKQQLVQLASPLGSIPPALTAGGVGDMEGAFQPLYTPHPKRPRLEAPLSFSRAIAAEVASCETASFASSLPSAPTTADVFESFPSPVLSPNPSPVNNLPREELPSNNNPPQPSKAKDFDSSTPSVPSTSTKAQEETKNEQSPVFSESISPSSSSQTPPPVTPVQCAGTSPDKSQSHLSNSNTVVHKEQISNSPAPQSTRSASTTTSNHTSTASSRGPPPVRSSPRFSPNARTTTRSVYATIHPPQPPQPTPPIDAPSTTQTSQTPQPPHQPQRTSPPPSPTLSSPSKKSSRKPSPANSGKANSTSSAIPPSSPNKLSQTPPPSKKAKPNTPQSRTSTSSHESTATSHIPSTASTPTTPAAPATPSTPSASSTPSTPTGTPTALAQEIPNSTLVDDLESDGDSLPSTSYLTPPTKSHKRKQSTDSHTPIEPILISEEFAPLTIEEIALIKSHKRKPKHLHKRFLKLQFGDFKGEVPPALMAVATPPISTLITPTSKSSKSKSKPKSSKSKSTTTTTTTSSAPTATRIPTRLSQKIALLSKNKSKSHTSQTPTAQVRPTRLSQRIAQLQSGTVSPKIQTSPTKSPPKKVTPHTPTDETTTTTASPVKPPRTPSTTPTKQSRTPTPNGKAQPHSPSLSPSQSSSSSSSSSSVKRPPPCSCHQCKSQKTQVVTCACLKKFCNACLRIHYGEEWVDAKKNANWQCPFCRGLCTCKACRVKNDPNEVVIPRPKPPAPSASASSATRIVAKYAQRMHTNAKQRAASAIHRAVQQQRKPVAAPTHSTTPSTHRKRMKLSVDAYDLDRFVASSPIPMGRGASGNIEVVERVKHDLHIPTWIELYDDPADDGYAECEYDNICGNWRDDWIEPLTEDYDGEDEEMEVQATTPSVSAKGVEDDDDVEMEIPGLRSVLDRRERANRRMRRAKEEEDKEKEREKQREREYAIAQGLGEEWDKEQERKEKEEKEKQEREEQERENERAKEREKERERKEREKEQEKEREKSKQTPKDKAKRVEKPKEKAKGKPSPQRTRAEVLAEAEAESDGSDEDTSDEAYSERHRGMKELIVKAQPNALKFKDSELLLLTRKPLMLPTAKPNIDSIEIPTPQKNKRQENHNNEHVPRGENRKDKEKSCEIA